MTEPEEDWKLSTSPNILAAIGVNHSGSLELQLKHSDWLSLPGLGLSALDMRNFGRCHSLLSSHDTVGPEIPLGSHSQPLTFHIPRRPRLIS